MAAFTLIAGGLQQIFAPGFTANGLGGVFMANFEVITPEIAILTRILGGFLLVIGCMLFNVRWNTVNGKLSGLSCIGCGVNIAYTTFAVLDKGVFMPRLFHGYAVILVLAGLHLILNPNPLIKQEDPKKK